MWKTEESVSYRRSMYVQLVHFTSTVLGLMSSYWWDMEDCRFGVISVIILVRRSWFKIKNPSSSRTDPNKNLQRLPVLSDSNNDRRISNVYINPMYVSTLSVHLQVENIHINEHLHVEEELGHLSYREIIRNSIQLPETRTRRKKRCSCKLLDKDNKHGRLFIAYVLLITLFVMTFCSIGLSIIIRTIPLKFFADCWKLAIALASLTFLIGVY
ncbi:hypothetical protein AVEN_103296-1, partial [Araneus ventricosus]